MLTLIAEAGITQKDAAERIEKETGDRVYLRTMQAWLADPSKPSARPSPGWAVRALEQATKRRRGA